MPRGPFLGLTRLPEGVRLAFMSGQRDVQIWEWNSGRLDRWIEGPAAAAGSVAFSADGRLLGSAGLDNRAQFWNVATREDLHRLEGAARASEP